ncbi:Hypothetical predicted protein [Mytilus galloprovincialis]|uniref:EGF-like domain-containing protein n=1 Tax=Mytilus galloprovincialis TaxID=29158 RepID=A0A8B6C879_MYTGA|nr:Hypothetical predicted protein [Mytilus galloprovincialis]
MIALGQCKCSHGYIGNDCTETTSSPPVNTSVPTDGLCSTTTRPCKKTNIYGDFVSMEVWYKIRFFECCETTDKEITECNKTNTQSNEIQTDSSKLYPRLHGQPKTKSATSFVRFAEAEKFTSEATPPKVNADKEKYIRKHSIPKESFNSPLDTQGQEESRIIDNSNLSHREKEHGTG